ncbi:hypothetical protein [Paenisporosarcina indica]|uniref:hypothetical protein n=1 Tax=Paenisporosarcina indica TaxID=650093 RepID=UPI00095002DC|nr:hypothetical protein [Paenisporosarcina indica]
MIIEIDGYFHQALLTGKKCSKKQLRQKYLQAKVLTYETRDFLDVFCRIHNFDQVIYDNEIEVEFVIDTDTDRIYTPSY